jgi:hypothetical protein
MPIENYLLGDEKVLFWSDFQVMLLYSEKGLIFKKEDVISENWRQITGLQFKEVGTISKRGIFKFISNKGEVELEGPANGMRGLFKAVQRQTINPSSGSLNDPNYE